MSFTLKERDSISVPIRMDNKTVLSYLMKMECTKNQELIAISKKIWQYLLKWKTTITAKYLPVSTNVEEDRESRQTRDSSEWKLNSTIFMKLCQIRGTPEMDLLVLRVSHQFPSTCPGKSTLSVRAGMLFRYSGLTSLRMFILLFHS